jgi:hypothetical protein
MTFLRIIITVIVIIFAAALAICFAAGVFDRVTLTDGEQGPYNLVFREHRGSYSGVKFALFDVYKFLKEKRSIDPRKGFAVFYGNPRKVKQEDLRCIAGYITDSLITDVGPPYKTEIFQRTRAVTGEFRLRTFMSQMAGPLKFYPRLFRFLKKENRELSGPVMEIYDMDAKKIVYVAPLK